jgi:hypothetical protein
MRPERDPAPARASVDELDAALVAARAERHQLPEIERQRRDAEFARTHPELLSSPARAQRQYEHYRRTGERIGPRVDGAIDTWAGSATLMLDNPKASPDEKKRAAQLAIIAAGLKRIIDPHERARQFDRAQRLFLRVYTPYIAARLSYRSRPAADQVPAALLQASEPTNHEPQSVSPTRGPPSRDDQDDDPPVVDYFTAGSADGPALVRYLEREGFATRLRDSGHKHWIRQLRRWTRPGARVDLYTVDDLTLRMFGFQALFIGADEDVWREAKARATKTPAGTHVPPEHQRTHDEMAVAA